MFWCGVYLVEKGMLLEIKFNVLKRKYKIMYYFLCKCKLNVENDVFIVYKFS